MMSSIHCASAALRAACHFVNCQPKRIERLIIGLTWYNTANSTETTLPVPRSSLLPDFLISLPRSSDHVEFALGVFKIAAT